MPLCRFSQETWVSDLSSLVSLSPVFLFFYLFSVWHQYESTEYMISSAQELSDEEKEKNFEDAQGFCEREGGNLITVSGGDINEFLVDNGLEYVILLISLFA